MNSDGINLKGVKYHFFWSLNDVVFVYIYISLILYSRPLLKCHTALEKTWGKWLGNKLGFIGILNENSSLLQKKCLEQSNAALGVLTQCVLTKSNYRDQFLTTLDSNREFPHFPSGSAATALDDLGWTRANKSAKLHKCKWSVCPFSSTYSIWDWVVMAAG